MGSRFSWVLFSQKNWGDGGNSTEQYARALAPEGCLYVHGGNSGGAVRLTEPDGGSGAEERPFATEPPWDRRRAPPGDGTRRGIELVPRCEQAVAEALGRQSPGVRKAAMFCLPDRQGLAWLEAARERGFATVYRAVDDWNVFCGGDWFDPEVERCLLAGADVAVASSRQRARELSVPWLPNACQRLAEAASPAAAPVVGFCGLAHLERFDLPLVRGLAARFPRVRFEVIGAERAWTDGNLAFSKRLPWEQAWERMRGFRVGLVPYRGPALDTMQPVKSWEYLGLGIPQLCRRGLDLPDHPSVRTYDDLEDCARTLSALLAEARSDVGARAQQLEFAARNTWRDRLDELEALL